MKRIKRDKKRLTDKRRSKMKRKLKNMFNRLIKLQLL
jgi:hypothetical protein